MPLFTITKKTLADLRIVLLPVFEVKNFKNKGRSSYSKLILHSLFIQNSRSGQKTLRLMATCSTGLTFFCLHLLQNISQHWTHHRNIFLDCLPYNFQTHPSIVVNQLVPHPGQTLPRNICKPPPKIERNLPGSLADNLKAANNSKGAFSIPCKRWKIHTTGKFIGLLHGLESIPQIVLYETGLFHIDNTSSNIRLPMEGLIACFCTKSTDTPRRCERSLSRSRNLNIPETFKNSTRTSRSLPLRCSPRT